MEVLQASGPGARVRVLRAAYHSSSGPGVPAASYMLHSSRRVISSGFNILESPTYPNKPLEISSTPLGSLPDLETENYKVTEPDDIDTEISEPSKWKGTTSGNSIRMPSEESSSTDNASIVDLDSRFHKGLYRKYSYDSDNSDINNFKRNNARESPLLDAPVALSTLKFKSLLNGSNDWNNRRKSYSFEDTSPLNETFKQSNDTIAMESSTDSGICKSSELVNDCNIEASRVSDYNGNKISANKESFRDWQIKNRSSQFHLGSKFNSYKEHDIVIEDPNESKISLQGSGKVTITVPITVEDDFDCKKSFTNDDGDRKVKKVGFCKTELHFAAESGRVNIIATDEKPPPSNDFRKRKSAFVPIKDTFEKPILLFGEKTEFSKSKQDDEFDVREFSDAIVEVDENTAATKSILKNKIPKPKPYLLGENMAFGDLRTKEQLDSYNIAPNGVSLINKQLLPSKGFHNEHVSSSVNTTEKIFRDSLRTTNAGSLPQRSSYIGKQSSDDRLVTDNEEIPKSSSLRNKFNEQMSPVPRAKTRQLRESELTYFGIDSYQNNDEKNNKKEATTKTVRPRVDNIDSNFESVRLLKQVSNSACNSETESEDFAEYQNIPLKKNFAPVPTPRSRVKYKISEEDVILKPILEHLDNTAKPISESRRSRSRKQEIDTVPASRSLSEPAKKRNDTSMYRNDELRRSYLRRENSNQRYKDYKETEGHSKRILNEEKRKKRGQSPLYVNITRKDELNKQSQEIFDLKRAGLNKAQNKSIAQNDKLENTLEKSRRKKSIINDTDSSQKKYNSVTKSNRIQHTEKLSTPEYPVERKSKDNRNDTEGDKSGIKKEHSKSKSSQRNNKEKKPIIIDKLVKEDKKKTKHQNTGQNDSLSQNTHDNSGTQKDMHKNREQKYLNCSANPASSKEMSAIIKVGAEKSSNTNGRRPSRRSEFVIKYDDKNGTVSSICKVKSGHGPSKQKHVSKERHKEQHSKESLKNKVLDKTVLRNAAQGSSKDSEWKK